MKKLFLGLVCLIMAFGLIACGEVESKEPEHTIEFIDARKVIMNETEYLGIYVMVSGVWIRNNGCHLLTEPIWAPLC